MDDSLKPSGLSVFANLQHPLSASFLADDLTAAFTGEKGVIRNDVSHLLMMNSPKLQSAFPLCLSKASPLHTYAHMHKTSFFNSLDCFVKTFISNSN